MNITLSDIKRPVQTEMEEFDKYFKSSLKSGIPLLNVIIQFLLKRKGKQIRPLFVFLTAKLHGEINHSTYVAAAMIELLHTATLIHDDVVDESMERRGFFSINALWKSKIAVLLGDFLLAKGLLVAVENKEYEMLEILSNAVKEMSEGEIYQLQKTRKLNITEEDYFKIIKQKTASLMASCAVCGAKSAGKTDEILQKMKDFGENIGIAFQIKDDLLDYQESSLIGKPAGNDIKEKKMTLPLIHSLENSQKKEKREIINLLHTKNHKKETIYQIRKFVKNYNGIDYAQEQMLKYKSNALSILDEFNDNEAKKSLINLVEFTVQRTK
ncbi:MAG: polyprenyl synthetase family protein [Bacteroidales bacterium]|nr:polyprenyl synthetase family protein [Bacteroidales bacterium]